MKVKKTCEKRLIFSETVQKELYLFCCMGGILFVSKQKEGVQIMHVPFIFKFHLD